MNMNYYISNDDYYVIRNGLLDNNDKVVKMSIQSLITQLEKNRLLNSMCTKDLCAILYRIVQNSDYKIRKWAYHLIAYKNTPVLINRCIENLEDGTENDNENITWILAIASVMLEPKELCKLYKQYAEYKINPLEYQLCTIIFSNCEINVTQHDVKRIVSRDDFLAKMWLTKIYACTYKTTKKKRYAKVVTHKIMNELLQEEQLNRYALWAFSTFEKVNLKKIAIKPYNAVNLNVKSQAWYYNCMFKDEKYVCKNRDHIEAVLDDFCSFEGVVQGGILRGLEDATYNLGYMENKLAQIYFELDENNFEDVPLLISLTQIFFKHESESNELKKILSDMKQNTRIEAIRRILFFYNDANKEDAAVSRRTFNFYGQNQYNEQAENANQINTAEKVFDNRGVKISEQIRKISDKLQAGCYDDILDTQTIELENMITNFEYELSCGRSIDTMRDTSQMKEKINELETCIAELKEGKIKDRKANFSKVLSKLSDMCTIIVATPQMINIVQNIMIHIRKFLNI